jgi:hypothetical protein
VSHFPDVMNPLLDAGQTFIDPVRFAADPEIMREYPALPYLTLRVATMATVYFDVDYCLSVIMPNHRAFYQRVFHSMELTEPRYVRPLQQQYRTSWRQCSRIAENPFRPLSLFPLAAS